MLTWLGGARARRAEAGSDRALGDSTMSSGDDSDDLGGGARFDAPVVVSEKAQSLAKWWLENTRRRSEEERAASSRSSPTTTRRRMTISKRAATTASRRLPRETRGATRRAATEAWCCGTSTAATATPGRARAEVPPWTRPIDEERVSRERAERETSFTRNGGQRGDDPAPEPRPRTRAAACGAEESLRMSHPRSTRSGSIRRASSPFEKTTFENDCFTQKKRSSCRVSRRRTGTKQRKRTAGLVFRAVRRVVFRALTSTIVIRARRRLSPRARSRCSA